MKIKVIKSGYSNLMMCYYVDYLSKYGEQIRTYFDDIETRNKFIINNYEV